jgi:hypothetical protein
MRAIGLGLLLAVSGWASEWVLVRTTDGRVMEGQTNAKSIVIAREDKSSAVPLSQILSVQSGAAASASETESIAKGLAAVQGTDRAARDAAVEELTSIGLPVMTPLLKAYKDTDQHEPRPLYRLFERIIPSYADGFDRSLGLIRMKTGESMRANLSAGTLDLKTADGKAQNLPIEQIRYLAVRQASVSRTMQVHALSHSTQIEYLDTGVVLSAGSKAEMATRGFVRLSWDTDSWASDADGLKQPGSPAYKSNLVDGQPFGALVGRVGAAGEVFFIGQKATLTRKTAGRLRLAVNDNPHWQNNIGTFYVTMTATDAYSLGDAQ